MAKTYSVGRVNNKELKSTSSGMAVLELEVTERSRVNIGGEWQDKYETFPYVAYGSRAEALDKIVQEGSEVYIEGKLKPRVWTDKGGMDHISLDSVSISELQVFGGRQEQKHYTQGNIDFYEDDCPF